jgi:CDP-diacylglycerol--glycerol-3-phosphate 3-phosphatidyltransferase
MKGRGSNEAPLLTLANALTSVRLVLAPVMIYLGVTGAHTAFIWVLAVSFVTDAADGVAARYLSGTSEFGARFDSLADAIAYTATAIAVVLLFPDIVRSEILAVSGLVASLTLPAVVGLAKYGHLTSYHTRLVKLAVGTGAVGLLLLLTGVSPWPFRIAAVLGILSGLEEIAITVVLDKAESDIKGLGAALRKRR